jgi:hypothetical protein
VTSEALKSVRVWPFSRGGLRFSGAKEGGACLDAGAADEAGVAGNHVFDVASRFVTELTTSLRDEMLGHYGTLKLSTANATPRSNKET